VLKVLRGHSSFVFSLCLIDDDLFSGSEDSMVFRWNAKTGEFILLFQETEFIYHDLAIFMIRQYGPYLLSGSFDGSVIKWNSSTGDAIKMYKGITRVD
jgi:WD40 repeat protein